jgi:hypothetical protein
MSMPNFTGLNLAVLLLSPTQDNKEKIRRCVHVVILHYVKHCVHKRNMFSTICYHALFQGPKLIFVIFASTSQFPRLPCCSLYRGRIGLGSWCVLQWCEIYTECCEIRLADSTAEMARLSRFHTHIHIHIQLHCFLIHLSF